MFTVFKNKDDKLASTPFSDFIRTAKSKEKKKVFVSVLEKSTSKQKKLISLAEDLAKKG